MRKYSLIWPCRGPLSHHDLWSPSCGSHVKSLGVPFQAVVPERSEDLLSRLGVVGLAIGVACGC